jgi:hypothetical protein
MNKRVRSFVAAVLAISVCSVTLFAPVTAAADITLPEEFYGDVTINGLPAPSGTVIIARIDTVQRGNFTTTVAGKYGGNGTFTPRLIVAGADSDVGKAITFWMSGVKASQSAIYEPGQTKQLALSFQPYPLNAGDIQIVKALTYLRGAQQPDGSIGGYVASGWAVMAIAAAGQNPNDWVSGGNSVVTYLRNSAALLDPNKATDWERSLLAIVAAGENPRTFGGIDYVSKVTGFCNGTQIGDVTLLNDDVWGILALSSIGEGQQLIPNVKNFIVSNQNTDGGWSWAVGGASDADNTAATISALIAAGEPSGSQVMAKATGYLKTQQQMNGGFISEGTTNSAVDSWVINAINSVGQSPIAQDWQKSGVSAVSHLLSLQNADGSFKWTASQPTNPVWMTAYAVPALLGKPYPRDTVPPVIASFSPASGGSITGTSISVSASYTDATSGVSPATVKIWLDNVDVTAGASVTNSTVSYAATVAAGVHTARVSVKDKMNNEANQSWSFTVNAATIVSSGGGGPTTTSTPQPGTTSLTGVVSSTGVFLQGAVARSDDALCTLNVNQGTRGLTADGLALSQLTVVRMTNPPAPPAQSSVIGLVYNFGPDGTTFDPPATLTMSYSPSQLPPGFSPNNLTVAMWDSVSSQWIYLESTVDTESGTVNARVSHFTSFTVLTRQPQASFTISGLSVSPGEVAAKGNVNMSVVVTNTGDMSGTYDVPLKIDNVLVETRKVTLSAGGRETVAFTIARDAAGTYTVNIGGLTGTFKVKAPAGLTVKSLTASPSDVYVGGSVNFSVSVANTADTSVSQTLTLKINDIEAETRAIALAGGASETITFTRTVNTPGTYTASVGALSVIFTVKPGSLPASPAPESFASLVSQVTSSSWFMWSAVAAGIVLVLLIIVRIVKRFFYY